MKDAGIELAEATFPDCLDLLRKDNDVGLPVSTTLNDALEFILASVDTSQSKKKAALRLEKEVMEVKYHHVPKSNGIVKFFKTIKCYKTDVDAMKLNPDGQQSLLPVDKLIMISQDAL